MAWSVMTKVNVGWAFCIFFGIGSFVVAKQSVVKNRTELMMVRRRLDERIKEEKEQEMMEKKKQKNESGM